jgi:hypothetical protein
MVKSMTFKIYWWSLTVLCSLTCSWLSIYIYVLILRFIDRQLRQGVLLNTISFHVEKIWTVFRKWISSKQDLQFNFFFCFFALYVRKYNVFVQNCFENGNVEIATHGCCWHLVGSVCPFSTKFSTKHLSCFRINLSEWSLNLENFRRQSTWKAFCVVHYLTFVLKISMS